ncbi:MAG: hypothetical protein MMC33_001237 [Icmadophila ericetorum]|nr:hypothetical protein [Icmadophila ericetorum]
MSYNMSYARDSSHGGDTIYGRDPHGRNHGQERGLRQERSTRSERPSQYEGEFANTKWQLFQALDEVDTEDLVSPPRRKHGSAFSRAIENYTDRVKLAASIMSTGDMVYTLSKPGRSGRARVKMFLQSIEDVSDTEFIGKLKALKKYQHWDTFNALTIEEFNGIIQRIRLVSGSRLFLR